MSKPSPLLRKEGSSTSSMYHPKLFRKWEIMMALNLNTWTSSK